MKTTLNKIRAFEPCRSGWEKLLKTLGKTKADDEPLLISVILESNGLDDALWCLRAVEGYDKEIRLFAIWCARQVQHLMTDTRSLTALDVAERYVHGDATREELYAANDAARDAYRAASTAANDAAYLAALAALAAFDAARTATFDAALDAFDAALAARDAASYTARDAARAAFDAARDAQEQEFRRILAITEMDTRGKK